MLERHGRIYTPALLNAINISEACTGVGEDSRSISFEDCGSRSKTGVFTHASISQRPTIVSITKGTGQITGNFQQVGMLLEKKVIERVWNTDSPGFYSRFFVVPKKQKGIWRSILDLRELNQDVVSEHFKMETAEQIQ